LKLHRSTKRALTLVTFHLTRGLIKQFTGRELTGHFSTGYRFQVRDILKTEIAAVPLAAGETTVFTTGKGLDDYRGRLGPAAGLVTPVQLSSLSAGLHRQGGSSPCGFTAGCMTLHVEFSAVAPVWTVIPLLRCTGEVDGALLVRQAMLFSITLGGVGTLSRWSKLGKQASTPPWLPTG
jgi:hypothetical protein